MCYSNTIQFLTACYRLSTKIQNANPLHRKELDFNTVMGVISED